MKYSKGCWRDYLMDEVIRPAVVSDAAGLARVHIESWRTTYKGIVPDDYLANLSLESRVQNWQRFLSEFTDKYYTYVAQDETGQIVGFVRGGPERKGDEVYKSELYAIYLLQAYQGRGLGKRLALTLMERLVESGFYSMLVGVLTENPACRFYEALGGQFVRSVEIEIGGKMLAESIYGWQDIHIEMARYPH
jgi:ribosomal protein S18 acetylase RimI-like enzyme